MQQSIGQRLTTARSEQFVGREKERTLFQSALSTAELPFCLLYLHGPGGIGKTTLLQAFVAQCAAADVPHSLIDARNIEPSPDGFLDALRTSLRLGPSDDPTEVLGADAARHILFIDTFEMLDSVFTWLKDVFLPQVSSNVFVVLAGQTPPAMVWPQDAGWQTLLRSIDLHNFNAEESYAYLTRRGVPTSVHKQAFEFTHGHPLALSLIADLHNQHQLSDELAQFSPEVAPPEVVHSLLKRFITEIPSHLKQSALQACALVRGTNEALLQEMLFLPTSEDVPIPQEPNGDTAAIFDWLRDLSFMNAGPLGLFPHDIAREALLADLRWRNPDWYVELHRRARAYYTRQLGHTASSELQKRLLYDCIFLHRDNSIVRAAFTWKDVPTLFADQYHPGDAAALIQIVAEHEGNEAAHIAERWLARQPKATMVFRDSTQNNAVRAFVTMLALHDVSDDDLMADPATRAAQSHIRQKGALRPGEGAAYLRFWMAADTYQEPSPLQSMLIVHILRHFLIQGGRLAYTFFSCRDADIWNTIFDYAEIPEIATAGFTLGGHRYRVFGHDWRLHPLTEWLARMAEKEVSTSSVYGVSSPPQLPETNVDRPATGPMQESVVLSESEFESAVRDTLRVLNRPDKLQQSPLLHSRLVTRMAISDRTDNPARAAALKAIIQKVAESLNEPGVRQQRAYRALRHTYLLATTTQENIADLLDLPFSTYRRHLAEGISALTQALWKKEIGEDRK
jgi:hypothetical protein